MLKEESADYLTIRSVLEKVKSEEIICKICREVFKKRNQNVQQTSIYL